MVKSSLQNYLRDRVPAGFVFRQGARRRLVAVAIAPTSNAAGRQNRRNPKGYGQFTQYLRRSSLEYIKYTFVIASHPERPTSFRSGELVLRKLAHIAAGR